MKRKLKKANGWINANIVFSHDSKRKYTNDAVMTSDETYDDQLSTPDTGTGDHYGYYIL